MSTLRPDPRNARKHTTRNQELIRQSLTELGPFRSIAVDGDDIVRAGNGVLEQAQQLGLRVRVVEAAPDELIAVKRPDLHGAAAEKAALYDNRTAELSEWDANVLAELSSQAPEVIEGVFANGELAAILDEADRIGKVKQEVSDGRSRDMAAFMHTDGTRIRPVIMISELGTFERAIRATGKENRGQALIEICRFYLEGQHAESDNERGQR